MEIDLFAWFKFCMVCFVQCGCIMLMRTSSTGSGGPAGLAAAAAAAAASASAFISFLVLGVDFPGAAAFAGAAGEAAFEPAAGAGEAAFEPPAGEAPFEPAFFFCGKNHTKKV